VQLSAAFDPAVLIPAEWAEFRQPTQPPATRRPYSLQLNVEASAFEPELRIQTGMPQIALALSNPPPGPVPVELTFAPRGSRLAYGLNFDLTNDVNRIRPTLDLPLDVLRPFGTWTLRLRNEADASRYVDVLGSGTGGGRVTWSKVGKVAPTNVARATAGGTASASSTYDRDTPPEAAINGDHRGATWPIGWADNTYAGYPDWLQVDFAGTRTLTEIDVYTTQDDALRGLPAVEPTPTMTFQAWGLMDFDVQYWTGSAWQLVPGGHVVNNNLVWRKFTFPAISTSRIRVMCYRGGFGYSRIVELEAFDTNHVNVALQSNGGHASASSVLQTYPPAQVIDGDRVVYHWVGQQPFDFPGWLRVDFSGPQTIDEIDVYFHQDYSHGPMRDPTADLTSIYAVTDFDMQYLDGANWVTVPNGEIRGNTNVWRRFTFPPIATTAVRVWIVASPNNGAAIQEVEAYTDAVTEQVWFDSTLPAGALPGGDEPWTWVSSSPPPFSGSVSHQSTIAAGMRQHSFTSATTPLQVNRADRLFAYAFIDPSHVPSAIMLQWYDGTWDHRAYWGADTIRLGIAGTPTRRRVGDLPATGQWVRLEVPASAVGLEGSSVSGMAFTVYGERQIDLGWLTDLTLQVHYQAADSLRA
jgi:hypothetical protein